MSPGKFFVFNYEVTFIYPNIAPFKGNETNLEARNKHEILFWKFLTCNPRNFRRNAEEIHFWVIQRYH